MDADTLWPKEIRHPGCNEYYPCLWKPEMGDAKRGCIYTPMRRMWTDLTKPFPPEPWTDANGCPLHHYQGEHAGYTQIFHSSDPTLLKPPPWHDIMFSTAGASDSYFQARWRIEDKLRPPFECLHLGECHVNWAGRTQEYADGTRDPLATERQQKLRELMARRGPNNPTNDPFYYERIRPS